MFPPFPAAMPDRLPEGGFYISVLPNIPKGYDHGKR